MSTVYLPSGGKEYRLLTERWRGVLFTYQAVERSKALVVTNRRRGILLYYQAMELSTAYLPRGGEKYYTACLSSGGEEYTYIQ